MTQRRITWSLAAILFVIMLTLYLYQYDYMNTGTTSFSDKLTFIREYAKQNDWSSTQKIGDSVKRIWKKGHALAAISHADDQYSVLNVSLLELQRAVESRNLHKVGKLTGYNVLLFDHLASASPKK
ncbi:DUF4363 family protein [Cohnella suwonensis]|uniref:DUF4363 family protein n=1 Tax=Cohnella suwonensis TaxID=696072 RepID=A0ABW0M1A8_9BACL